jgi:hypothetical protein
MRLFILLSVAYLCSCLGIAQPNNRSASDSQVLGPEPGNKQPATKPATWPPQLEMRVIFEPTAFPSGQNIYVMYELCLTNFGMAPVSLSRIEIFDADRPRSQPVAAFETEQLETMLQP